MEPQEPPPPPPPPKSATEFNMKPMNLLRDPLHCHSVTSIGT